MVVHCCIQRCIWLVGLDKCFACEAIVFENSSLQKPFITIWSLLLILNFIERFESRFEKVFWVWMQECNYAFYSFMNPPLLPKCLRAVPNIYRQWTIWILILNLIPHKYILFIEVTHHTYMYIGKKCSMHADKPSLNFYVYFFLTLLLTIWDGEMGI